MSENQSIEPMTQTPKTFTLVETPNYGSERFQIQGFRTRDEAIKAVRQICGNHCGTLGMNRSYKKFKEILDLPDSAFKVYHVREVLV